MAVNDVSFHLKRGEILGPIGPNGAGKTTLVSMVNGTLEPSGGHMMFEGRSMRGVPAYRRAHGTQTAAQTDAFRPMMGLCLQESPRTYPILERVGYPLIACQNSLCSIWSLSDGPYNFGHESPVCLQPTCIWSPALGGKGRPCDFACSDEGGSPANARTFLSPAVRFLSP